MNRLFKLIVALLALACASAGFAQAFPNKPVRIVLPFAAGSTTDVLARIVGQKLSERLGQQVIIDPKPGGNGVLAVDYVAKAPPDGYTLIMASNGTHGINVSSFARLPYDPVKDFEPITQVGAVSYILVVRNGLEARTLREYVALGKSGKGKVSFGTAGGVAELSGTLLGITTGVDFNRVPYKAPSQALVDLMGNRLDSLMDTAATMVQHIQSNAVRPIAVTSKQRSSLLPNVPTVAESGYPEYEAVAWQALLAPAGTPPAVIARLNADMVAVLNMPEVRESLLQKGIEPSPMTPARLGEVINAEIAKWAKLFRDANIPKTN